MSISSHLAFITDDNEINLKVAGALLKRLGWSVETFDNARAMLQRLEDVQPASILYRGSEWLIAKLVCCGLGVAMISWRCGVAPKLSGAEISQGVTRTILWATLFVLFVHFVFSLFEFKAVV